MTLPSRRISRLLCVASLLIPALAAAQVSTTRGFTVGAHLQATSIRVEDGDTREGGGVALRVGYGFNRIVTGFIHLDGSVIEIPSNEGPTAIAGEWTLGHAEFGVRFHFANSLRRWVPYVETSAGGRVVSVKNASVDGRNAGTIDFNGGAFTVGGGLSAFFTEKVAFDVSLKFTGGEFTEIDLGGLAIRNLNIDAESFRFGLGFVWWP